jgi:hypothetical protein
MIDLLNLFSCGLFNDAFSSSDYIVSSDRMINEYWVGHAMEWSDRGLIKELSRHLPGRTEENHEQLSQDSRSPSQDLNAGPQEYEAGVVSTRPRRSVIASHFYIPIHIGKEEPR